MTQYAHPPKYRGAIGPVDAMDATSAEFGEAYSKATDQIFAAVIEFERITGRVVDAIALERIDVSNLIQRGQYIRQASIHFLPKPGEVAW